MINAKIAIEENSIEKALWLGFFTVLLGAGMLVAGEYILELPSFQWLWWLPVTIVPVLLFVAVFHVWEGLEVEVKEYEIRQEELVD